VTWSNSKSRLIIQNYLPRNLLQQIRSTFLKLNNKIFSMYIFFPVPQILYDKHYTERKENNASRKKKGNNKKLTFKRAKSKHTTNEKNG
jgi:hypothetical protein